MDLPYKISTLLYGFKSPQSPEEKVLLLRRNRAPNQGLWSPCGGKLKTALGESPYQCAQRELREETGMEAQLEDLHLAGIVSECGYEGCAHWLMFLFEIKKPFTTLPPAHPEGEFGFFSKEEMKKLPLPETDREFIWPLFWKHRGCFFSAHCRVLSEEHFQWTLEEASGAIPLITSSVSNGLAKGN